MCDSHEETLVKGLPMEAGMEVGGKEANTSMEDPGDHRKTRHSEAWKGKERRVFLSPERVEAM